MPVLQRKADVHAPKVNDDGALLPVHQAQIIAGTDAYIELPCSPQPASTVLGTNTTINFDIERDTVREINDICLRFRVTCSTADVDCLPPNYWLDRIVIEAERGSGEELIHLYPENWIIWDYLTEDRDDRETSQIYSNYQSTQYKSEGAEKYWTNERTKFKTGQTRDIYLKIPALFFHLDAIDMSHIRSDLRLRLELSNDIVISGDRANLSLDSLDLVIRNVAEEDFDHNHRINKQMRNKHKYIYLDTERLQISDKTLTAGSLTKFELDQFTGKMAFALVVIKPSTTPSASDRSKINFVEVGPEATFDITNPSAKSLLGQGTALKEGHIYQLWKQQTGNPHVKGLYLIPFSYNCKKANVGVLNGFMEFVGLRDYLEIKFDNAPTQEVHTISLASTATGGTYRYAFQNGYISEQQLDFNDNTTTIKTAIDAIPQLEERNISITANQSLDSGSSQTITFNSGSGEVSNEVGKITIIGDGIPKVSGTSVSTVGRRGFTTGSNYQVNVYMFKYRSLTVDKNGRLTATDL